jgi:pyrroloquinoline quinone biosynthesis protein E
MDGKVMSMELFKWLVDETSPYCKSYSLFIWGEPLVLADFRERVQYVSEKKRNDCGIEISTNGMLLGEDMIRFLRRYEVRVIVSFDGADKPTFEKIRAGSDFERVCRNAKLLNKIYEDTVLDIAPATYTSVQRDNQIHLPQIMQKVSTLGFRRVGFGLVTAPAEFAACTGKKLCDSLATAYTTADTGEMFIELYPTKVGEYVYWGNNYVPAEDFVIHSRCDAPLANAVVRYDGEVCLCCNYGASVGNVTNRSFLDMWRSTEYSKLREAVNSHKTTASSGGLHQPL